MWPLNVCRDILPIWRSISPVPMKHLQALLERIGLNHHESAVYLQLLENGEQAASVISKVAGLPRSTVRNALDKLCERGIVTKLYKRNTQYYSAKPPAALTAHLTHLMETTQSHLAEVQAALPMFQALHGRRSMAPKVQMFEGPKQVIEAFNRCLFQDPPIDELLIFTSYEFLKTPVIRKNDDEFFVKMRVKKGIRARVLLGKTSESNKMIKKAPHELRERRFIPQEYQLPGNIHVYGNSVMYFSASEGEYLAVLVESAMMADTMRALFEFMWEQCA
jgi:HTH-type transcriptional regulator, sugar sensing transcriptional regulator